MQILRHKLCRHTAGGNVCFQVGPICMPAYLNAMPDGNGEKNGDVSIDEGSCIQQPE